MRFVHIADMHFDVPFTSLNKRQDLCEKRRLEQRNVFRKVIEYIKEENIPYLFISGDLYEHEYVKKSTIDYINNLFKEIPNTKIFISPGNHDPYVKDSFYDIYNFSENVYVFRNSRIERFEDENLNIYGMAFTNYYLEESPINSLMSIPFSNKPSILIAHIDLNGSKDKDGFSYNSVLESKINSLKFDYCAIGHIHKRYISNDSRICYPGSTIALGFDEQGEHGMIVGEVTSLGISTNFIRLDEREFKEVSIDISNYISKEQLIEEINNMYLDTKNFYKLVIVGKRNFEIDERELLRLINNENIFKISNKTELNINIEELENKNNLKGYFAKELRLYYENGLCSKEEYEKALEIGLNAM